MQRESITSGDYSYTLLDDGTAEITSWTNIMGRVRRLEIPEELDGKRVTRIGRMAFHGGSNLISVSIPDSVTQIGVDPFGGCDSLTDIHVSPDHPTLAVVDGALFSRPDRRLVCCPRELSPAYVIPQGTLEIGDDAFSGCKSLRSVSIPDSVTRIGNWAFSGCKSLTSVTIPDGVARIGDKAFFNCGSLTSVSIPDSVTQIGSNPFLACASLTDISVSPEHPVLAMVDGLLFSRPDKRLVCCPMGPSEAAYTIPQGTLEIGDDAFYRCESLRSVSIPDSVTRIGRSAFEETGLTSVSIPDSVTQIDTAAFRDCRSLTSVTIPGSVTQIARFTFFECKSLRSVSIPNGVTRIEDDAFYGCCALKSVSISDSVNAVDGNPFAGCSSLKEFRVSADHPALAFIDGALFSKPDMTLISYAGGFGATEYAVPQGTRNIGDQAFSECSGLRSVSIPGSVTGIGKEAFSDCESLTSVSIPDGVEQIGDSAFFGCDSLKAVTIPDSVKRIGLNAFFDYTYDAGLDEYYPPSVTFTVGRGSCAEKFCRANYLEYRYADAGED